jgi:hypothetical protein
MEDNGGKVALAGNEAANRTRPARTGTLTLPAAGRGPGGYVGPPGELSPTGDPLSPACSPARAIYKEARVCISVYPPWGGLDIACIS